MMPSIHGIMDDCRLVASNALIRDQLRVHWTRLSQAYVGDGDDVRELERDLAKLMRRLEVTAMIAR